MAKLAKGLHMHVINITTMIVLIHQTNYSLLVTLCVVVSLFPMQFMAKILTVYSTLDNTSIVKLVLVVWKVDSPD